MQRAVPAFCGKIPAHVLTQAAHGALSFCRILCYTQVVQAERTTGSRAGERRGTAPSTDKRAGAKECQGP